MSRELVVIAGDDIGREVVPLAVRCLRALLPDVKLWDVEAGWEHAWRTGAPISEEGLARARTVRTVLMGPERPFPAGEPSALERLTRAFDLFAALYPLKNPAVGRELLLLAEHPQPGGGGKALPGHRLTPAQAWSATRLGNLAGELWQRQPGKVALAHDSEDEFAHAVAAGIGEAVELERVDALFLINEFDSLAPEFDLILTSAATRALLVPHLIRTVSTLPETGRLILGPHGCVAMPAHGPLREQLGWGFVNPLGTIRAVEALLRYGWQEEAAALRLETAIARAAERRRTPDRGGLHTMYEVASAILHELENGE